MPSVSTMVLRSMRLTGEKGRDGTLSSDEQTQCLAEFQSFMESISIERLNCYTVTQDSLALTASTASYTIGTGGAFNVTRPNRIEDPCFIRDNATSTDTPLVLIGAETYGRLADKAAGYTVPQYLFYDQGFSATSTGTLYLYPSPSPALTLYINSCKTLGPATLSLTTQILLPPGYQAFIESNFALQLASGVVPVSPELAKMARDSRAVVKALNAPDPVAYLDIGGGRGHNIITGP